ncbi:MAG TPA: enoyl-CoA hydratase-related protein, partial [Sphingomicrobium sp.]|nr:enoyl-CoA hydratase-related protein [Sphingomicrobium sp.]
MTWDPASFEPKHFLWEYGDCIATITLNRPERKNPLTFESYDELRDTFWQLKHTRMVRVVLLRGAGGNFCSGGDV